MSKLNVRFPGFKYTTKGPTVIDAFIVKAVSNYDNKELTLYDTDGDTPLAPYTNEDLYIPASSNKCVLFTPEGQPRLVIHTRTKSITKNISSEDIGAYFNAESELYINEQEKTIEYRYVITRENLSESLKSTNVEELSNINSLDDDNLELNVFENSKNEKIEKISDDINALFTVNVATVPLIITFTFYLYTQLPEDEEITPNEGGSFAYIGSYEVKYNPYARDTDLVVTVAPSTYMYLDVNNITTMYSVCKRKSEFSKQLINSKVLYSALQEGENLLPDSLNSTDKDFNLLALPCNLYNELKTKNGDPHLNKGILRTVGAKIVYQTYQVTFTSKDIELPQITYLFNTPLPFSLEKSSEIQSFETTSLDTESTNYRAYIDTNWKLGCSPKFMADNDINPDCSKYPFYIWACSESKFLIYTFKNDEDEVSICNLHFGHPKNNKNAWITNWAYQNNYTSTCGFSYKFDESSNTATISGDILVIKDPYLPYEVTDNKGKNNDNFTEWCNKFNNHSQEPAHTNISNQNVSVMATYDPDPKNQSDYKVVPYIMQNGTEESLPNVTYMQNLNVFETDGSTTKNPIDSFNKIIKTVVSYDYDYNKLEEISARSSFLAVDSDNIPLYQGNSVIKFTADKDQLYIIKVELVNSHVYNYKINNDDLENPVVSSRLGDIEVYFQSGAIKYIPLTGQLNKAYYIGNGAQAEVAVNFNITPEDSSSSEDSGSSSSSDSSKFPDPVYSVAVYQADNIEEFKSLFGWPSEEGLINLGTVESDDGESVNLYNLLDQCIVFNLAKVIEESNWILYDEKIEDADDNVHYEQRFIPYVSRYMFAPDKCVETRGVYQMAAKNVKDFLGQVKILQVKTQINS